ncbi:twin-arginine translocase TatA/TatE family subunit [Rarobacter faecitabidus]|uniref:Sec-independent protein translocase protein TatB n=2 Tax=Rarobacter faecitabidus TaxID=13243 RepID=A0A542ZV41_RARFA|nr:sec-independent protein translocase protein TatB [Rarobacter faecitabidus]
MFGINGGEFLVLLVVLAIVVGPSRLPQYAEQLARLIKGVKRKLDDLRSDLSDEAGASEVNWQDFDPRRYDPRRIVRDALFEDEPSAASSPGTGRANPTPATVRLASGELPPWDAEAT